jgi:hypothetical protein
MIREIEKEILELKGKNKDELTYDVVRLFKEVLESDEKNKLQLLHNIYDELLGSEIIEWFKKRSIKEFSRHGSFVDWYTEKATDPHIGKSTYVKATIAASFNFAQDLSMRVIRKNLCNLSQDDFKNLVLSPLSNINSKGIHIRYADLYNYYINQYVNKKDTIKELQTFTPFVQVQLLDKLIKNKWFDSSLYLSLQSHIHSLNPIDGVKILGSIFKYESNIENMQVFKKDFIHIISAKTIDGEAFFKGVNGTREKIDYIFKNLIVNEQDYNKALDNNLTSKGNSSCKKEFNIFLNNIVNAHFSKEKELTETQFLIIFKRCCDCGQREQITTIMDKLKDSSPDMFNNIKNSLRDASTLNIYDDKVLDFSRNDIKAYFVTLLHNYLLNDLEKEDKPTRKMKI